MIKKSLKRDCLKIWPQQLVIPICDKLGLSEDETEAIYNYYIRNNDYIDPSDTYGRSSGPVSEEEIERRTKRAWDIMKKYNKYKT